MVPRFFYVMIRSALPSDLDTLVTLWNAFMADQQRYVKTTRLTKANRERVRTHVARLIGHEQVLVATVEGDVRGYTAIVVNSPPLETFYASAAITDLYVAPEWRGRGIGRSLLREAIAMLTRRGMHAATLQVAHGNVAARALYVESGFLPMSETMILPLDCDYVRFGPEYPTP